MSDAVGTGVPDQPSTSDAYRDGMWHFYVVRYLSIATCAWLFYDHILTMRQEFELIWKAPKSFAKYGFIFYRYAIPTSLILIIYSLSGFAVGMNDAVCRRLVPATAVLEVVPSCIADVIAVLHVSTLWNRNIKVIVFLMVCCIATTITGIAIAAFALSRIHQSVVYVPSLNICSTLGKPETLVGPWIAGMAFDFVVLITMFLNAVKQPRGPTNNLLHILQEDGAGYFVIVFVVRIFDLIVIAAAPLWVLGLGVTLSLPAFSVSLARFVFELREQEPRKTEHPDEMQMGNQALLDQRSARSSSNIESMSCFSS